MKNILLHVSRLSPINHMPTQIELQTIKPLVSYNKTNVSQAVNAINKLLDNATATHATLKGPCKSC